MFILLILASVAHPAATHESTCGHLNEGYVSSQVSHVRDLIFSNPAGAAKSLGNLTLYWERTCPVERYAASRRLVSKVSSLLAYGGTAGKVSAMLLDVGPNLKVAQTNIDAAILDLTAAEGARSRAASPLVPSTAEEGRRQLHALNCVKRKIVTGEVDRGCR